MVLSGERGWATHDGPASLENPVESGWAGVSRPEKREKSHGGARRSDLSCRGEERERSEGEKRRRGRKTNEPRNKRGIGAIDGSGGRGRVWRAEGKEEGMRGQLGGVARAVLSNRVVKGKVLLSRPPKHSRCSTLITLESSRFFSPKIPKCSNSNIPTKLEIECSSRRLTKRTVICEKCFLPHLRFRDSAPS